MKTLELSDIEIRLLKETLIDHRYDLEEKIDNRLVNPQITKIKIEGLKKILKKVEKTLAQN